MLQRDGAGQPIHVVWGIPAGQAVRDALRAGDITRGAQLATHLYRLTPVEA